MANLGITATEGFRIGGEAAARSGLPGTTPGGDESDTDTRNGHKTGGDAGEPERGPGERRADDRERPNCDDEDQEEKDDEPPTPEIVARTPSMQEWVDAYLVAVNNRMCAPQIQRSCR